MSDDRRIEELHQVRHHRHGLECAQAYGPIAIRDEREEDEDRQQGRIHREDAEVDLNIACSPCGPRDDRQHVRCEEGSRRDTFRSTATPERVAGC